MTGIRLVANMGTMPTVPRRLEIARIEMLGYVAEGVAEAIGRASQSSQIAANTHVASVGRANAVISVGEGIPFARIRDIGGTIVPRRGRALAFASGEFRPKARQRGIRYIRRAEQQMPQLVDAAYQRAFSRL